LKERFIAHYTANIAREGNKELLNFLHESDFFSAPASTRYHGAYEGGLVAHSVNVYERLVKLNEAEGSRYTAESAAICGLLHDLCKVNYYSVEMRNRKKADGKWEKYPCYIVSDKLPFGHGEKSQYIISSFMRLTREESMAIRWHMGGYDKTDLGGGAAIVSDAFRMFPLAVMTHAADLMATYMDEINPEGGTAL
jgi:hypothetical protein